MTLDIQTLSAHRPVSDMRHYGSCWTIADALKVRENDPTTTMPLIPYSFSVPPANNKVWQWDSWALRDIHGRTVTINGQFVLFALVAPKGTGDDLVSSWINRNDFSYIGWFTSPTGNGTDWTFRGRVIKPGANPRNWEWSGSAVLREGRERDGVIDLFYTSVGTAPASVPSYTQGQIRAESDGTLALEGFDVCTDMFAADGVNYANFVEDLFWDFRDPHVFRNPEDGRIYALFEGNVPGMRGDFTIGSTEMGHLPPGSSVPSSAQFGAAAIGLARLKDEAYEAGDFSQDQWEMLPALVTALGVNDQMERPHIVFRDGLTYLFTISHHSTYTGNSTGPDGVYGFVSRKGLFGPYEPLNGSGLVLGNPSNAPLETYSHFVDTDGYVQSFINFLPDPEHMPADPYQAGPGGDAPYRIGGCLAPTVRLVLEGQSTFLTEVHAPGQIFAAQEVELIANHT